jgi:hypothetical protein
MKRCLVLVLVLIAAVGIFLYSTNPTIKARFANWMGVTQGDSIQLKPKQEKPQLDTISSKSLPRKRLAQKLKIPKTIKPDKYAQLDKYAKETPDKYSHDNAVLAEYLGKLAKNDLEKARLIYSWIATHIRYDDEAFNTGNYKNESADSVLERRTAVCSGFSSLFHKLGLLMGLEVEKVSGYAKGYKFQPGDKFSSTNHAWNVVKIDGTWQLVDVTWGSVDSEATDQGFRSKMSFDPFWFCVSPEEFIFSHLPEAKEWQLTESGITMNQYEELPLLNDSFFKMGFDSKEVFKKAIAGEAKEFVETFPLDYPLKGVGLPFTRRIERDKEYTFSLESEYLENVVIIDGEEWIELKKEGNIFEIKHTPKNDKIQIAVKINWFDLDFWTIVVYETVEEEKLTAHYDLYKSTQTL